MAQKKDTRPNMKDIAELAGVSTATVSHVINETRYVSDEVKERVCKAMDMVGYYPNFLARGLRSQATKTIGLIIPDIGNFYYTGVSEGVDGVLKEYGYHMILSNSYDNADNEIEIIKLYNSLHVDGVVMVPAIGSQSRLSKYLTNQYPIIFADRKPHGLSGDCVFLENVESTYKSISLLIEKGHRRIALVVGGLSLSTTNDRIKGYKKALIDHDMEIDGSLILEGSFSYGSGYEIAEKIMEDKSISAAFFANEMMTIGAVACFKLHQFNIPQDIAIISCNDSRWTEITSPPLTIVSQPSKELGRIATNLLIERIHNKSKTTSEEDYKQLSVPTKIIIRESC